MHILRIAVRSILGSKSGRIPAQFCGPIMSARWNSDMGAFREEFRRAQRVLVLTGAGVSAESGVPTFRGAGGFWRRWQAQELATLEAFEANPSLVWEFYHYRREVMITKKPNKAHLAIAECEERLAKQGRHVTVVTQNIDELHRRAGTSNLIEMHGNLFKTRCTKCGSVEVNTDSPIAPSLAGRGAPDKDAEDARIPVEDLPRCKKVGCGALLRPHVVWFGEGLDPAVLDAIDGECDKCDLCLVIGTSSVVYPAAMYAPMLASQNVTVAEFNTEETHATSKLKYHFHGPAGDTVTEALARHPSEPTE